MMDLREYCMTLALSIAGEFGLQLNEGDEELEKLITNLQTEFIEGYDSIEKPYGDTEEDLVRYLMENITIAVEEE